MKARPAGLLHTVGRPDAAAFAEVSGRRGMPVARGKEGRLWKARQQRIDWIDDLVAVGDCQGSPREEVVLGIDQNNAGAHGGDSTLFDRVFSGYSVKMRIPVASDVLAPVVVPVVALMVALAPALAPALALMAALMVGPAALGCAEPAVVAPTVNDQDSAAADARFLTDAPCPRAGPGLTLDETAGFAAGDAPHALVVIMGGSTEVDDGAIRFAAAANGGDVLVLRATGSTSSYTSWFADELPIDPAPRAVATLRTDDVSAGADDAVLCRVARADAIWLAGGDQSDYLLGWPSALHQSLARALARGVAVGGTSAGSMSLSSLTFDARIGSLTSQEALLDPAGSALSLTPSPFFAPALAGALVDTHFSERDRLGRLIAFSARALVDGHAAFGLGIDEQTSLTIDEGQLLVEGAGDVWVVRVAAAVVTAGVALSASAVVAPLSLQTQWPPADEAPGSRIVVVETGTLVDGT